jgi:hypothetical protein
MAQLPLANGENHCSLTLQTAAYATAKGNKIKIKIKNNKCLQMGSKQSAVSNK